MIEKLFNNAHLFHQTSDEPDNVPNYPIAVHVDNGGSLCLSQEGRDVVLDRKSLPEFFKLLRKVAAEYKP